jgi:hypothetical protein
MNNKTVLLVVVSMFVMACVKSPDVPQVDKKYGCDRQNLNLLLDVNKIQLVPKKIKCVEPGTEYIMKITVLGNDLQISAGDVTMMPKPGNPAWLSGTNKPDKKELTFTVDKDEPEDAQYSYFIKVEGVGDLDPIVKVVRSF